MFLSHAVVPVFVFTIMLNFFYLYSPISSQTYPPPPESPDAATNFTTCQECQNSTCYKETNGTCGVNKDNSTFFCFTCSTQSAEAPQYPCEETCKAACSSDPAKECVCEGPCYTCLVKDGLDKTKLKECTVPTLVADECCTVIPYGPPADAGAQ